MLLLHPVFQTSINFNGVCSTCSDELWTGFTTSFEFNLSFTMPARRTLIATKTHSVLFLRKTKIKHEYYAFQKFSAYCPTRCSQKSPSRQSMDEAEVEWASSNGLTVCQSSKHRPQSLLRKSLLLLLLYYYVPEQTDFLTKECSVTSPACCCVVVAKPILHFCIILIYTQYGGSIQRENCHCL